MAFIESKPLDMSRSRLPLHGFRRSFNSLAQRPSRKDLAVTQKIFNVFPGESIQKAIDAAKALGGGTVFLKNGTYNIKSSISVYSNITITGESQDGVILDFGSADRQVKAIGTDAYTTGTIAINGGSNTVTGSGTTFTSSMVGQFIIVSGSWYEITAFGSTTSLTIDGPYIGDDLTGEVYAIATLITNVEISKLTVQNSTSATGAVYFQYCDNFYLDKFISLDNTRGLGLDSCGVPTLSNMSVFACGTGIVISDAGSLTLDSFVVADTTAGDNLSLTRVHDSTANNFALLNASADGLSLTSCNDIAFFSYSINGNGGQGVEFVSGNKRIQMNSGTCLDNVSDGIKLTASTDYCTIALTVLRTNGGYGINIAASTCDNNIILGNQFDSNTTAATNNSGTGTLIRSNIGQADN